jgi:hypothetical protein
MLCVGTHAKDRRLNVRRHLRARRLRGIHSGQERRHTSSSPARWSAQWWKDIDERTRSKLESSSGKASAAPCTKWASTSLASMSVPFGPSPRLDRRRPDVRWETKRRRGAITGPFRSPHRVRVPAARPRGWLPPASPGAPARRSGAAVTSGRTWTPGDRTDRRHFAGLSRPPMVPLSHRTS